MLGTKVKASLFALALAGATVGAEASDYDFGEIGTKGTSVYYGTGFSFTDTYSFTLAGTSDVTIQVTEPNTEFGLVHLFGIGGLDVEFDSTLLPDVDSTINGLYETTFASLVAGMYSFTVSGIVKGVNGGFYAVGVDASPVPVPAAFLLFGSGLAGLVAARRSRKSQKDTAVIA